MKSKSIAIVLNTSWNIYNFRLNLLKSLQNEGWRIIAIAPRDSYSQKIIELGIEFYDIKMNNKGTNPIEDSKLFFALLNLYQRLHPTIILHYTIKPNVYGSIAAGILRIPSISNISGLGSVFLNKNLSSKIAKILYKMAMFFPQKVFFQNKDDLQLFLSLQLITKSQTELLPGSGVDTLKFIPITVPNSDSFTFLFIGRLLKDKGLIEYIEACRLIKLKYPKVICQILGALYDGNPTAIHSDQLQQWQQENLIEYLGAIDDVRHTIAQSDCVVLPSYREGLSRVLLEAASMAKPIVTTDVPGCRDVVECGVNGFLCYAKDSASLFQAMEKMVCLRHEDRVMMGNNGRAKVLRYFDEKLVIQAYRNAINNIR